MKFEREKNIPAFQGKNWRARMTLRNQAMEHDPWILRLRFLMCFLCFMPPFILPAWLGFRISSLELFIFYMVVSLPFYLSFYALFITPRIRKALESEP
jgi:hypothetical protein